MMMLNGARSLASGGVACSILQRCMSSSAVVVDEMIAYARSSYKDKPDEALDILKSGLGFQPVGVDAGRLHLVQAEFMADRSRWPEVSQLCQQAAVVASEAAPSTPADALMRAEVELAASLMGTRAFLTQHKDAEAFQMAQQCLDVARKSFAVDGAEDRRWQGLVLSTSIAALAQHAAGDLEAAEESFEEVVSLIDHVDPRTGPARPRDPLVAQALKQTAAFKLAQRQTDKAAPLAARAVAAAQAVAESETSAEREPLLAPLVTAETLMDARLQQAQVAMHLKDWDAAEQTLSLALNEAEGLASGAGPTHCRIAFALLPLARVYSRTGRVTLAEGLYREAAKILKLDARGEGEAGSVAAAEVHPSVAALAAWRYAQLLTALPRRSTEAAAWHKLAADLYDDAPLRRVLEPVGVFGSMDNLTGKGNEGCGVVLDLMARRALPRPPPPPLGATK